jgi:hypothetical protein
MFNMYRLFAFKTVFIIFLIVSVNCDVGKMLQHLILVTFFQGC